MKGTLAVILLVLAACAERTEPAAPPPPPAPPPKIDEPPRRVAVEHVLIAFQGTLPGATRTREEAEALAEEVLARAKEGADFLALRDAHSDDRDPGAAQARGPYRIANRGVPADPERGLYPRDGMAGRFADVAFSLPVGGIGMAAYAPGRDKSPFGWHVVKRVE